MFFYFLKIIFDISTSKWFKTYKSYLILVKKKFQIFWERSRSRSRSRVPKRSLNRLNIKPKSIRNKKKPPGHTNKRICFSTGKPTHLYGLPIINQSWITDAHPCLKIKCLIMINQNQNKILSSTQTVFPQAQATSQIS